MHSALAGACSQIIEGAGGKDKGGFSWERGEKMGDKLICIAICIVVTVIINRILAIHTFKVIDGYVKDLFEITKESIRNAHLSK